MAHIKNEYVIPRKSAPHTQNLLNGHIDSQGTQLSRQGILSGDETLQMKAQLNMASNRNAIGTPGINRSSSETPSLPLRNISQKTPNINHKSQPITIQDSNKNQISIKRLQDFDNTQVKTAQFDSVSSGLEATYETNGYLIPAEPPCYSEFPTNDTFTNLPNLEASIRNQHKPVRSRSRFDSGLGDCESVRASSQVRFSTSPTNSIQSGSNPRLSTHIEQHYEDIDQYNSRNAGKQYSNTQPRCNSNAQFDGQDSIRGQHIEVCGVTTSDTEDNDLIFDSCIAETILEPLHNPQVGSLPHTYSPLETSKHGIESPKLKNSTKSIHFCFIVVIIIILVMSLTALILSIYSLIMIKSAEVRESQSDLLSPKPSLATMTNEETITSLKLQIDDLLKKNSDLRDMMVAQERNLTFYIEENSRHLLEQQQNLSGLMGKMEVSFDSKIQEISLTPGLQGPPGKADFSQCVSRNIMRNGPASQIEPLYTVFLPSEDEISNYFVTFAYCAYEGATDAYLESQLSTTTNRQRYRCKCWGKVPNITYSQCTVTISMCPVGS